MVVESTRTVGDGETDPSLGDRTELDSVAGGILSPCRVKI